MGRIKCRLCLKKKQAKKSIFAPKIAPRVERSDPARNSYFPANFLSACGYLYIIIYTKNSYRVSI